MDTRFGASSAMPTAASRLMPTLRRVVLAGAGADRTDGQLLGAFVSNRDADAFAGLIRRHGPMVLGVCRRVTGDHSIADDAFQAVFIVLARRAGAVKPREQVGNWLYGVAYRTALKARMVQARRRSREKQVDVMPEPPVSHPIAAEWADLQPVIDEELARLPDKLRLPVVLCDLEGRAQRDVAKQLGIPPATLATRLASARRALATRLTKRGVTLSGGALAGLLSIHGTAAAVPHALAHGVARAAEVVAGGGAVSTLVSAHAVQLSEGVMRMMLLTKLKAVAVTVLTLAALSGGLGLGLVPAYGNTRGEEPTATTKAAVIQPANPTDQRILERLDQIITAKWTEEADDATFLRRLSLDLRGLLPTPVEAFFFIADEDKDKRDKVVTWMVDDDSVKAYAAKKLNIDARRIRAAHLVGAGDGKAHHLVIVLDVDIDGKPHAVAFSPDGKTLAVELTANGRYITPMVAPFVTDLNAGINLNVSPDAPLLNLSIDKNAQWTDVYNTILRLQPAKKVPAGDSIWLDVLTDDPKNPKGRVYGDFDGDGRLDLNVLIDDPKTPKGRTYVDVDGDGKPDVLLLAQGQPQYRWAEVVDFTTANESDADFLRRVIKDARGGAPTALEQKYFIEDKDAKKREKLLDMLLRDPAVAKKLGEDWKKKMLASGNQSGFKEHTFQYKFLPTDLKGSTFEYKIVPTEPMGQKWKYELKLDPKGMVQPQSLKTDPKKGTWSYLRPMEFKVETPNTQTAPRSTVELMLTPMVQTAPNTTGTVELKVVPKIETKPHVTGSVELKVTPKLPQHAGSPPKPQANKIDKIVAELLAAGKSDADILDGITLVVLGRLPTDAEKRLTLGLVSKAADRKAAWLEVVKALAGTGEGRQRSDAGKNVIDVTGRVSESNTLELHFTTDGKPEFKTAPPQKK